jgi:hypothetical protein
MKLVANDTVLADTACEVAGVARRWPFWAGLAAASVIAGLAGPFGTYAAMPVPLRLAYWSIVVFTTFWIGFPTSFTAANWVEARGIPARWSIALGAAAATLPVALWLAILHAVMFSDPVPGEFFRLLPYVCAISLGSAYLFEAIERRDGPVAPGDAAASDPPDWLDRLPPTLGRNLVLLQAQDHYLRAVTPLGETLLRGSIGEASEALGDLGVRVHRSWWVSRSAITACKYRGGAPVLILQTQHAVPVGRSFRRSVRDVIDRARVGGER